MQMLLRAVLIGALHAALKDAEVAFNGVRVDCRIDAGDVLVAAMVDSAVGGELDTDLPVNFALIGQKAGFLGDVRLHDRGDRRRRGVVHDHATGAAGGAVH